MFAAGPLAERHLTGGTLEALKGSLVPRSDWANIKYRFDALQPDVDLEWLLLRSRALVARRWREIEFVATALVEHARLSVAEVIEHVELAHEAGAPSLPDG
jgi:hypothetical protein